MNRYEGIAPVSSPFRGGVVRGRELRPNPDWTFNFTYYRIKEGDRIDFLAHKFLKNKDLWWYILDANPEIIEPWNLKIGQVIRIPNVLA